MLLLAPFGRSAAINFYSVNFSNIVIVNRHRVALTSLAKLIQDHQRALRTWIIKILVSCHNVLCNIVLTSTTNTRFRGSRSLACVHPNRPWEVGACIALSTRLSSFI